VVLAEQRDTTMESKAAIRPLVPWLLLKVEGSAVGGFQVVDLAAVAAVLVATALPLALAAVVVPQDADNAPGKG